MLSQPLRLAFDRQNWDNGAGLREMTFDDFQQLARLYVIGALDGEEMPVFEEGRQQFGPEADAYVAECRRLESVFALSLDPVRPRSGAKYRLLSLIRDRTGQAAPRLDPRTAAGKSRPLHGARESDLSE